MRTQLVDNLWTDLLQLVCRLVTTCVFLRVYNPSFAFGKNVIECHFKKIEDGLKTADLYMTGDGI